MKIRLASENDAEVIGELYKELVPGSKVQVLPERISEIKDDPKTALFIAEVNGVVCGSALVCLCPDVMYASQPFSIVENVVVSSSHRGNGIGKSLFNQIEQFCIENDCSKIMLLSSIERVESHGFFEKLGFKGDAKRGFVKYRSSLGGANLRL